MNYTGKRIKLVIVGDGYAGKTCLFMSFVTPGRLSQYIKEYEPTVLENRQLKVKISDTYFVNLDIWDTAGQEEMAPLRKLSYAGADAFMIIYSCDDPVTLQNAEAVWIKETVGTKELKDSIFTLVGTKTDLEIKVSEKAGDVIVKKYKGSGHFRVCSFTGLNVEAAFNHTFRASMKRYTKKKKKCFIF
eukprot:maker-scaffold_1-snap-gene-8.11-mRNA-1 protein AED:0.26 eAED:0.26 QI:61/1/1/1/1/1/2/183/187